MIYVELVHDFAKLPTRGTSDAGGLDLYSCEDVNLKPYSRTLVDTGVSMAIPHGYVGLIWPRSGIAVKSGIDTGAGVIDADYRNVIGVLLFNHTEYLYPVHVGDRIAQIIIQPVVMCDPVAVSALNNTDRGESGFGSTGR